MKVINGRMKLNNGEIVTDNSNDYDVAHLETNSSVVIHKDKKLKSYLDEKEEENKKIISDITSLDETIKLLKDEQLKIGEVIEDKFNSLVEKVNLVNFAKLNKIDTTLWDNALIQAIDYCILNKKTLFIPNGDYLLNGNIEIKRSGEQGLIIEGESKSNTVFRFKNGGIKFDNLEDTIDYQKRISFVQIKNITFRKQTIDKIGTGLDIKHFGYFRIDNVKLRDFEKGLSLYNGSEFDMFTSEIMNNAIGIYLENPITVGKQSDLANINFYSCRIYGNDRTSLVNNSREVNFIGCALMNYNGAIELNGITNIFNFVSCDFENQQGTNDLIINSSGIINITDSSMNNPYSEKIILNSNCTLNLKGTLIQGNVLKTIIINDGVNPTITNDKLYLGYYTKSNTEFLNYPKPNIINIQNLDFVKGSPLPFSFNANYTISTKSITNEYSICFDRLNDNDIQFNLSLDNIEDKVKPTYVEVIMGNAPSLNPLRVVMSDGTQGYNFQIGGGDSTIQTFEKDGVSWRKFAFLLPPQNGAKKVSLLQFVLPKTTVSNLVYIDTVRVYGEGQFTKLYCDGKPIKGKWKLGDCVYPKELNKTNSSIGGSYINHYVCTSPSSDVNTNSTFSSATINLV